MVAPLEPVRPERMGQAQSPRPRIIRRARQERRNSSRGLEWRVPWHALCACVEAAQPRCCGPGPALKNGRLELAFDVCGLEVANVFNRRGVDKNVRNFRNRAMRKMGGNCPVNPGSVLRASGDPSRRYALGPFSEAIRQLLRIRITRTWFVFRFDNSTNFRIAFSWPDTVSRKITAPSGRTSNKS